MHMTCCITHKKTFRLPDFAPENLFFNDCDMDAFSSLHAELRSNSLKFSTENWLSNVTNFSVYSSGATTPMNWFCDGDTAASKLLILY